MICSFAYLRRRPGTHLSADWEQSIKDVLWAHSRPEYGLQHVSVKPKDDGVLLHLFLRGTDTAEAAVSVEALVRSAHNSQFFSTCYWPPYPLPEAGEADASETLHSRA